MATEEGKLAEEGPVPSKQVSLIEALTLLEFQVGTVLTAVPVPKSELLHLTVSFGPEVTKNVLARIGKFFQPEDLVGNQYLFVTNLPPRPMKGIISEAMIFAAKDGDKAALLTPTTPVASGTQVA